MSNKKSPKAFDTFSDGDILTYLWVGTGISYSTSLTSLVDLSIDAYVRESSPSDVCETDSFIHLEDLELNFFIVVVFFVFPKSYLYLIG